MSTSIAIADDHQLIIDGLEAIIKGHPDFELVGTAKNGQDAIQLVSLLNPRIIFMDIDMPVMNGLEATAIIKEKYPDTAVVVLTMYNNPSLVHKVTELGAEGYLLKNANRNAFLEALSKVSAGGSYFSPELKRSVVEEPVKKSLFKTNLDSASYIQLTEREREVLKMIAEGHSNREIGDKLFISHRTVDTHRTNLMKKLNIHNIAGLIRFAYSNGLTT